MIVLLLPVLVWAALFAVAEIVGIYVAYRLTCWLFIR